MDDYDDPLAPARGIVNGVAIGAAMWALMATVARIAWRRWVS